MRQNASELPMDVLKLCVENSLSAEQKGNLINYALSYCLQPKTIEFIIEFGSPLLNLDKYITREYFKIIGEIFLSGDFEEFENLCFLPFMTIYSRLNGNLLTSNISSFISSLKKGGIDSDILYDLDKVFEKLL